MKNVTRRILHFVVAAVLIGMGLLGMRTLMAGRAPLKKHKPSVPLPMARVIEIQTGPRPILIVGQGTVRPLQEIQLVPQVGGKVVYMSSALVDGGAFKKGSTLLRIEPVDYQLAVALYESKVKDSESRLKLLEEEASVAREEWLEIQGKIPGTGKKPPPLVVKEPQLAAAKAKLEADRAELKKTELQLERTRLRAPFSGRVSGKTVDVGQYVSPGKALATLYSTQVAEILVPLENEDLSWFHVPGFTPGNGPGALATARARIAGKELSWRGQVVRTEGKLDERTRMINVVVRVEKPYAGKPPLAMGLFVTVEIDGRILSNAALIPRSALHPDDVVWVVDEDSRLRFRKVRVARFSGEGVVIRDGLQDGDRVVISPIKAVTEGMRVRVALVKGVKGS